MGMCHIYTNTETPFGSATQSLHWTTSKLSYHQVQLVLRDGPPALPHSVERLRQISATQDPLLTSFLSLFRTWIFRPPFYCRMLFARSIWDRVLPPVRRGSHLPRYENHIFFRSNWLIDMCSPVHRLRRCCFQGAPSILRNSCQPSHSFLGIETLGCIPHVCPSFYDLPFDARF
jgi:hypothetical protein